jgi:hypothetical protein
MAPRYLVLLAPISDSAVLHLECRQCLCGHGYEDLGSILCDLSRHLLQGCRTERRGVSMEFLRPPFHLLVDQVLTRVSRSTSHRLKLLMTMRVIWASGLFFSQLPLCSSFELCPLLATIVQWMLTVILALHFIMLFHFCHDSSGYFIQLQRIVFGCWQSPASLKPLDIIPSTFESCFMDTLQV